MQGGGETLTVVDLLVHRLVHLPVRALADLLDDLEDVDATLAPVDVRFLIHLLHRRRSPAVEPQLNILRIKILSESCTMTRAGSNGIDIEASRHHVVSVSYSQSID